MRVRGRCGRGNRSGQARRTSAKVRPANRRAGRTRRAHTSTDRLDADQSEAPAAARRAERRRAPGGDSPRTRQDGGSLMKAPIATFGLTCLLLVVRRVRPGRARGVAGGRPPAATGGGDPAAAAGRGRAPRPTRRSTRPTTVLPAPTAPDQIKPATIALPTDPIEPWLLTKEAGPFMVMAKTFRGPEAERYALALAMELRRDYGLPAYILRTKDFPMRTQHPQRPPDGPAATSTRRSLTEPEKVRSYDEAAVLVGNEKTLADSEALLHRVKKIKPKCLDEHARPSSTGGRAGPQHGDPDHQPVRADPEPLPRPGQARPPDHPDERRPAGASTTARAATPSRSPSSAAGRCSTRARRTTACFGDSWLKKSPLATAARRRRGARRPARQGPRGQADGLPALRLPRPDVEQGHDRLVQLARTTPPPSSSATPLLKIAGRPARPATTGGHDRPGHRADRPGRPEPARSSCVEPDRRRPPRRRPAECAGPSPVDTRTARTRHAHPDPRHPEQEEGRWSSPS